MNVLEKRLAELKKASNQASQSGDLFWKPEQGENIIRLVPYVHDQEYGFVELAFHYRVAEKTITSPLPYGQPDPMDEFAHRLKANGGDDNMKLYDKLRAKERFYAPIIVRGRENEGVFFYAFGKTVLQTFLSYLTSSDWGNVRDTNQGRDCVITYTVDPTGKSFPDTQVMFKPNITPVAPADQMESVMNSINNVPDLKNDIFGKKVPSYDELMEMTYAYLRKTMSPEQLQAYNMNTSFGRNMSNDNQVMQTESQGYQAQSTQPQPPQPQPPQPQPPQPPQPQGSVPPQPQGSVPPQPPQQQQNGGTDSSKKVDEFMKMYQDVKNAGSNG